MKRFAGISLLLFLTVTVLGCGQSDDMKTKKAFKKPIARKHLFSLETSGPDRVWVVGFEGVIHHSADGGKTWVMQKAPVEEDLYNVCFVNDTTGWIVGKHGVMFKTADGGSTWQQLETVKDTRLFDAHFINETTGWVVGTMGTILHTTDGGASWTEQGWGEDRYYNGVFFIDENRGWIVGEYSTMYMTTDGGAKWTPMVCKEIEPEEPPDDFPPPPPHLYGIYFQDENTGWMTGMDGIIIKTRDGGATWKRQTPKTDFTLYQIAMQGQKGWAVGEKGNFLVSSDNGNTWQKDMEALKTRYWLRDVVFSDAQNGWIIGAGGTIIQTRDGGKSWKGLSGLFIR